MGCGMSTSRLDPRTDDNNYPIAKHKTPVSSSPILDNPSVSNHHNNRRSVSSPISVPNVDREEEEGDDTRNNNGRSSNVDDVNNAGSLWIGSPSFREYCVVRKDSVDVDNLMDSHVNNAGKKDISEEREINMQKEDKPTMASNEVSKTVTTPKKRNGRKLRNVFHLPGRQMVES